MILVNNITKSFSGKQILKDFSFEFKQGEITLIKGANGSGKSTLINIISCVIKPDFGEIYFSNKKVKFYDYKYRNQVGYLLQKSFLLEKLNACEYLMFLLKVYRNYDKGNKEKILNYLSLFDLPQNVLIEKFSEGMKKKLSIISAFVHNPKYILLDEPTASLDDNATSTFTTLLNQKRKECTIIISSPNDTNYFEADKHVVLT